MHFQFFKNCSLQAILLLLVHKFKELNHAINLVIQLLSIDLQIKHAILKKIDIQTLSEIVGTMQKFNFKLTNFLSRNFDQNVYCFPQEGVQAFASFKPFIINLF